MRAAGRDKGLHKASVRNDGRLERLHNISTDCAVINGD